MIDIAVPRDIDPAVGGIDGITLFDMDDLQQAINRNLSVRRGEANKAETVVDQEVKRFDKWITSLDVLPTIAELRKRAETIAEQVVTENLGKFENLTDAEKDRLEAMAQAIVSRMLHEPTLRLKRSSGEEESYVYIQALRELFALDAGDDRTVSRNGKAEEADNPGAEIRSLDEHRGRQAGR
jgi:glutamyl-tRNA reductase